MSRQGQGVNKAQLCTGLHGTPHAAVLNELCCSLALMLATEDMILRIQVPGWVGAIIYSGSMGDIVIKARSTEETLTLKKGVKKAEYIPFKKAGD